MTDGQKNTERVETKVTERASIDLMRAAAFQDRSVSELMRVILMDYLYGHCRKELIEINEDNSRI